MPAFRRFWYPVGFAEDLLAGPLARRVLGVDLVVWDDGAGGAAAAVDRCPHRTAPLSAGWAEDGCIVCPYHGWRFGPDGPATHIPQHDPALPIPPAARLATVHGTVRHGVVWVALEDPVGGLPEVPGQDQPGYRTVRQFDEVWATAAPHLVDNSFDPAHVAYVHRKTFGTPANARIDPPAITATGEGLRLEAQVVVENHLELARRTNGVADERTVRRTTSRLVAPFLRVMEIVYPNGLQHTLVTGICPVDDGHLRLVQWAVRNDTEQDVPAEEVVAFDRAVVAEDRALLELMPDDYVLDAGELANIKVDRGTIAVRKVYRQFVDGTWPALLAPTPGGGASPPLSGRRGPR